MLEDRDYMRQPVYHDRRVSFTIVLLIANAAVFLIECLFSARPRHLQPDNPFIDANFALSVEGLQHGFVWQFLTYQFMHASIWHLLVNSWAIYFFGREMETVLGWKRFLALFLSSGVIGGIFQVLAAWVWPQFFGGPVVGASAGAFGLVAAFAAFYPDRELFLLLFFVIPVRMRAKTLLIFLAVLAGAGVVFSESIFGGNVANAAHLGGMLTGFFYVRKIVQGNWWQWNFPSRRRGPRELVATRAGKNKFGRSADPTGEDFSAAEFLKNEVDPILDKISAHGIQSLTARERETLEKARAQMERR
jgi:membrane associated rhomboid family serine protease